ncbi:hypothetical protein CFC21_002854, partial [Triticum aestivum]
MAYRGKPLVLASAALPPSHVYIHLPPLSPL